MADHKTRRSFLSTVVGGATAVTIVDAFCQLHRQIAMSAESQTEVGFGPLHEVADETTGLPLLKLPEGFHYCSYGWTNEPLTDGRPTPSARDGMAVIQETENEIVLCRNHEIGSSQAAFGDPNSSYDSFGGGGCTNLIFDRRSGTFTKAYTSLVGTVKNCAGGATPWGTWLSCEETVVGPESKLDDGEVNRFTQPHGFVFEVPVDGNPAPKPIKTLGRFVHEALAIDPNSGIVYLTEDRGTSGLYRMVPDQPGNLDAGGKFQMLASKRYGDVRKGMKDNETFDVFWVDIEDRLRPHSPGAEDALGVYSQGKAAGGLTFARLEGCAYHDGKVFVTATSGGNAEAGQVWIYDPTAETLSLHFESPNSDILDMPDNMAVSPRGGILLCEDGDHVPQRIQLLTKDGKLFPLSANNIVLDGLHGHRGDFRGSEWAGATFTNDGEWLFVNIQTPGVTFAITGPWQNV